jgi:hypothetical protein
MKTIADLIATARRDVLKDDKGTDNERLWKEASLLNFAYEAIAEACARVPLLKRISHVAVVANTAEYKINNAIRQINLAKLDSVTYELQQTTFERLSIDCGSAWRTRKGTPTHYVKRGNKITLFPMPIANDTLVISSSNNFIYPPETKATPPDVTFNFAEDIDEKYHAGLMNWIAYKCFQFPEDIELTNHARAFDHLKLFNEEFGIKHTALHEQFDHETPMYAVVKSRPRRNRIR